MNVSVLVTWVVDISILYIQPHFMKIFTAISFYVLVCCLRYRQNFEKLVSIDEPLFEDVSDFCSSGII